MVNFLESQIGLLERQTVSPDVREVEDLIAFHLTALERLETHLRPGGLSEADRGLVPLFQRWFRTARNVKELARAHRDAGHPISAYDDLLRAINRSKPIAESFDHFVDLNISSIILATSNAPVSPLARSARATFALRSLG